MTTNLEMASIAQQIQDKSSDNVSVNISFGLNNKLGFSWCISVHIHDSTKTVVLETILFNPYSSDLEKHRMMMLAKYGFNSQYIK